MGPLWWGTNQASLRMCHFYDKLNKVHFNVQAPLPSHTQRSPRPTWSGTQATAKPERWVLGHTQRTTGPSQAIRPLARPADAPSSARGRAGRPRDGKAKCRQCSDGPALRPVSRSEKAPGLTTRRSPRPNAAAGKPGTWQAERGTGPRWLGATSSGGAASRGSLGLRGGSSALR